MLPLYITTMKAILFYSTAVSIIMSLCLSEAPSWAYITLIISDIVLVSLCKKHLTIKDVCKYSGYNIWYKMIKP